MIRKAMRYVEASGDVEKFTAELSRVFFSHLCDACKSFMELFSQPTPSNITSPSKSKQKGGANPPNKETLKSESVTTTTQPFGPPGTIGELIDEDESDMGSLSYLVGWIQEQMSVFVAALARQVS